MFKTFISSGTKPTAMLAINWIFLDSKEFEPFTHEQKKDIVNHYEQKLSNVPFDFKGNIYISQVAPNLLKPVFHPMPPNPEVAALIQDLLK